MKKLTIAVLISMMGMQSSLAKPSGIDQVSYSVGYMMGSNVQSSAKDLNQAELIKGMKDGYSGKPSALSQAQMEQVIANYQQQQTATLLIKNTQQEKAFLAQNAKKAGVITTKSGLQYQILKQGKGKKPKASDIVKVKYTGKLLDGTVFDSTDLHGGEAVVFPLDEVIAGWTEGVQLMPVGSQYRFFVPSSLAYGEQGMPQGNIEPNAMLVFDIELLAINPKD